MAEEQAGVSRRFLFKLAGAAAAAAGVAGHSVQRAAAHDLKPTDPAYHYDEYEKIVNRRDLRVRQVYEWPNIKNEIIFGNVRNGMNGFQFSYGIPDTRPYMRTPVRRPQTNGELTTSQKKRSWRRWKNTSSPAPC